jgi:multiple sugar transport system ATP-binding protein
MRAEISKLQRDLGVTMMYVTHDQVEAMTMGTRIAIMRKGSLQQLGDPQDVYDHPANLFVATFIGSPPMNLLRARLERGDGGRLLCAVGEQQLELAEAVPVRIPLLLDYVGRDVAVGIRPEHLRDRGSADSDQPLRGEVRLVEALGFERLVHIDIAAEPVLTDEVMEVARDIDAAAVQTLEQGAQARTVTVVARSEVRFSVNPGDTAELAIDSDKLHFFDLDTGHAIT